MTMRRCASMRLTSQATLCRAGAPSLSPMVLRVGVGRRVVFTEAARRRAGEPCRAAGEPSSRPGAGHDALRLGRGLSKLLGPRRLGAYGHRRLQL